MSNNACECPRNQRLIRVTSALQYFIRKADFGPVPNSEPLTQISENIPILKSGIMYAKTLLMLFNIYTFHNEIYDAKSHNITSDYLMFKAFNGTLSAGYIRKKERKVVNDELVNTYSLIFRIIDEFSPKSFGVSCFEYIVYFNAVHVDEPEFNEACEQEYQYVLRIYQIWLRIMRERRALKRKNDYLDPITCSPVKVMKHSESKEIERKEIERKVI